MQADSFQTVCSTISSDQIPSVKRVAYVSAQSSFELQTHTDALSDT